MDDEIKVLRGEGREEGQRLVEVLEIVDGPKREAVSMEDPC